MRSLGMFCIGKQEWIETGADNIVTKEERNFAEKINKQAVAELGQTQVGVEVIDEIVVKVRS